MNKEIISFETAKLAKEKGFPQNYEIGQICRMGNKMNINNESLRPIRKTDLENGWRIFNEVYVTQSVLQRWLREEHKINVFINYADTTPPNRQTFKYQLYRDKTAKEQIGNFNSYEEALEKGLQEALKLLH